MSVPDAEKSLVKQAVRADELYAELFPKCVQSGPHDMCIWHGDGRKASLARHSDYMRCFGACDKSYDVYNIWMKARGGTFEEAHEALMDRAGLNGHVAQPRQGDRRRKEKEREERKHFPSLDAACAHYTAFAVYRYYNADGSLNHAELKVRKGDGKVCLPLHEEPDGLWYLDLQGVTRTLFGLPELLESDSDAWVIFAEGPKDAQTAQRLGFVAVTSGSSGSLKRAHEDGALEPLRGRRVALFADRDEAGAKMEQAAREILPGIVQELRICTLPNSEEIKGYDLSDYVADVGEDEATQLVQELITDTVPEAGALQLDPKTTSADSAVKPLTFPKPISFRRLTQLDIPAPQMIVSGLIAEGVTILAGPPKVGKSWFSMQLSLAVATGAPFLGTFHTTPGSVFHLALEDNPRRFCTRLMRQLNGNVAPENAEFIDVWPLISHDETKKPGGLTGIHRWLESHHADARLIVIDTLQKIRPKRGKGSDLYEGDYAAIEGLQRLAAQYSVAVVICHHLNKTQGHSDDFNRVSGTSGLTGAADATMILTKPRGAVEGALLVAGRDVEESRSVVSFDRDACLWSWQGTVEEVKTSEEREEILAVMETTGTPMRPKDIHERLAGRRSLGSIQKSMTRMKDKGQLESSAKGRGWYVIPPNEIVLQ